MLAVCSTLKCKTNPSNFQELFSRMLTHADGFGDDCTRRSCTDARGDKSTHTHFKFG